MTTIGTFGVGCFHFQSFAETEHIGVGSSYFVNLREFLQQDSSVRDVSFAGFESSRFYTSFNPDVQIDSTDLTDLPYLYPMYSRGTISINLYVPHRLQEEYVGGFRENLSSERINVQICYCEYFPVAFVSTENPEDSPSTAVMIVWKHFRKIFKRINNINFCMLGPSPFHADFYVKYDEEEEPRIEYVERPGYDDVDIFIKKEEVFSEVMESVYYRLKEEIGHYYSLVRDRNDLYRQIYEVGSQIEEDRNFRRTWKRLWMRPSLGDVIYDNLVSLERIQLSIDGVSRELSEFKKQGAVKFGEICIHKKLEEAMQEILDIPISQHRSILSTMKERYSVRSTNNTVMYSTLAGAIIGALIANSKEIINVFLQ